MKSRNMGNHSSVQLNTGCIFYRVSEPFFCDMASQNSYRAQGCHRRDSLLFTSQIQRTFCSLTDDSFWCEQCHCCCQVTTTINNNPSAVFVYHLRTDRCASSLKFYIHYRKASVLKFVLTAPKIIIRRWQIERAKARNCHAVPVFTSISFFGNNMNTWELERCVTVAKCTKFLCWEIQHF